MLWLALAVVGCLLILLIISIRKKAARARQIESAIAGLDRAKVEELFWRAYTIASRRFEPAPLVPVTGAEADYHLEVAAWCKDRMNELDGLPHGPSERIKLRFQILNELKRLSG
jgi:hypothetical protein